MRNTIWKLVNILAIPLLLQSCFKEDTPVTPRFKNGTMQVDMDKFYSIQSYVNLFGNSVISTNKLTDWDLGFECSEDGFHIVLNHAKIMSVSVVIDKTYEEVQDTLGRKFRYERPEGHPDSTAFSTWWEYVSASEIKSKNLVYIVNRGISEKSKQLGLKKVQILGYLNGKYTIKVGDLKSTVGDTLVVSKNLMLNYQTILLNDKPEIVTIEPPSDSWQLHFTRYTQFFTVTGFEIYSVTGVFINTKYCSVAIDSLTKYEKITSIDIPKYDFNPYRNSIGYEWKYYGFDTENYTVDTKKNYIIKVHGLYAEDKYFKLRFIDFYKEINGKLEKGYPKYEYQAL